jgi:hypothetical protein
MSLDDYDSKNIYLKKDNEIVGLHSTGVAGPHEYTLIGLDGSESLIKTDFMAYETWGNEYDQDFNMLGRGSFRVHTDIETAAKELELDGWIRFERSKNEQI